MPMISDTVRNLAASLVVMTLIIAALVLGKDIFIPLALSAILAFILAPMVSWLVERRLPHGAAVGGIIGMVVILLAGAAIGFSAQMLSVTTTLDNNKSNLVIKLRDLTGKDAQEGLLGRAIRSFEALEKAISNELSAEEKKDATQSPIVVKEEKTASSSSSMTDFARIAIGPMATFLITILFTAFLLLQNHDLRDRIVRVLGTDNMSGTTAALSEAGDRLGQLFLGQAMLNAGFGLFIAISLWLIGVPNPLLWGVTAALLRFVPYIGAFLSSLPPLLLAAAVEPGWTKFTATAAVFLISEPIMGHVLDPLILGKRVGLSPFAMVAAASFWTLIWGPVGLLLAAPLTMVLVVIGENIPQLNFLSVLLGDKPALDPNTQFYHRLLSNDPASAVEQIESQLETSSLKSISDTIVLPALRLAALDQRRGRIDNDQIAEMKDAMNEVLSEIPYSEMSLPAADSQQTQNYIVPARGIIDLIASDFVATALEKTGICTSIVLRKASGMLALASIPTDNGKELTGNVILSTVGGMDGRHLRFLAKRAAKEYPSCKVIICDWGYSDQEMNSKHDPHADSHNIIFCSNFSELASLMQLQRKSYA